MNSSTHQRRVLQWFPSPRRRVLVRYGFGLAAFLGIAKLALKPWSWRYIDDVWLDLLFAALLIPSLVLGVMDLRIVYPPGHCRKCGYDLTGNLSGICPECGERV